MQFMWSDSMTNIQDFIFKEWTKKLYPQHCPVKKAMNIEKPGQLEVEIWAAIVFLFLCCGYAVWPLPLF